MALPTDVDKNIQLVAPMQQMPMNLHLPDVNSPWRGGMDFSGPSGRRDTTQTADSIFQEASRYIFNAIDKLEVVNAIKLQEQRNVTEAITGIEQNNLYVITDMEGKELFAIKENSSCYERTCFCCCPDWKPWRMDFYNIPDEGIIEDNFGDHFMHLERPCNLSCCCLCRPFVQVSDPDGKMLGRLREPRSRWSYAYTINDTQGNHILNSEAGMCQSGRFCRCPGFQVSFPVFDVSAIRVAEVRKTWTKGDCCPCCFQDWNKYVVEFGQAASPETKLLLVSLAVVVQMRHFDTR